MTTPLSDVPEPIDLGAIAPAPVASDDSFVKPNPNGGSLRERLTQRANGTKTEEPPKARKIPKHVTEPPSKPGEFTETLQEIYGGAGMLAMPFNASLGSALMLNAEKCANAWDELAQKNPSVRHTLRLLTQGGAWGKVVLAHAPIVAAVMAQSAMGKAFADNVEQMLKRETEAGTEPDA
jgi:hypothetical protein